MADWLKYRWACWWLSSPRVDRVRQFVKWRGAIADPVAGERSIVDSNEGIPCVLGDGKYPHDPPRPASACEIEFWSRLRAAEEERDALRKHGDELQSSASRVATWVQDHSMPYEVAMAAAEVLSAVEEWTVARTEPVREAAREALASLEGGNDG